MSAAVEFMTGRVPDALVIPVESVSVVDHRSSCYVIGARGLERRAISTRNMTTDLVEVTGGLNEGERVVARYREVHGIGGDDRFPVRSAGPATEDALSLTPPRAPGTVKG